MIFHLSEKTCLVTYSKTQKNPKDSRNFHRYEQKTFYSLFNLKFQHDISTEVTQSHSSQWHQFPKININVVGSLTPNIHQWSLHHSFLPFLFFFILSSFSFFFFFQSSKDFYGYSFRVHNLLTSSLITILGPYYPNGTKPWIVQLYLSDWLV